MAEEQGPVKKVASSAYEGAKSATVAIKDNPGHAVTGAVIGTLFVPGLGTVVGAYVGAWIGKKNDPEQNK